MASFGNLHLHRKRQQGQALPLGIAAILFTTILAFTLYNTGQITSEKMRLTNAVDAATYSGLVYQARALNFQSYTNRAMVANQVSIAQVVSFVSWSKYVDIASRNLNSALGWFPAARPWTQAFRQIAQRFNQAVLRISRVAIPVLDYVIDGLSRSQGVLHYATMVSTQDVIREVVRRNDPNFQLTGLSVGWMGANAYNWNRFTTSYESNFYQNRMADVIQRSRDGWSNGGSPGSAVTGRDRGWAFTAANIGIVSVEVVKGGQTRLFSKGDLSDKNSNDLEWEWKGKDTLSLHLSWICLGRLGPTTCRQEIPLGWGAAFVSTDRTELDDCGAGDDDGGFWAFWRRGCGWSRNRWADTLAEREKDNINVRYGGIRPYRDVANLDPERDGPFDGRDPRFGLWLEVRRPRAGLRTSSNVDGLGSPNEPADTRNGIGRGMFRVNDRLAGAEISAVSAGEVYFRRPAPRRPGRFGARDNLDEYGNLFNPYWDVHLTDAGAARALAWAAKGLVPVGEGGGAIGF